MTTVQSAPAATVRALFEAIDTGDVQTLLGLLAQELHFRFGNADPVEGKAAFSDFCSDFFGSIRGIRHEIHDVWEIGDDTVVAVMDVWYRRRDGREFTLPCCNVFRLNDGLVLDYRIFMDISPVLSD
jgi:ketosteroid isomerase-like protein